MNKEEVRHLKLFLNRTTAKEERKDVLLFDYIRRNGKAYDEDKIIKRLYGNVNKNAFYRLKNRLAEDISKSLLLQYYAHTDLNFILHQLALSRHFHLQQQFFLAQNYLAKAEKKAEKHLHYDLLDIIYADYIKLSHDYPAINPEKFIQKRKENRKQLHRLQEIDDILAALIYRIRVSANYSPENVQVVDLLQKTISDFTSDPDIKDSPVLRFKIYQAVSRILLQQRNYHALEAYLKETFEEFSQEGLFNKSNHDTKLQMLTYLANSLFKNNKLKEALTHCEQLNEAMDEFGGVLRDKYLMYYYNALVNNYSQLNVEKALQILEEAGNNPTIQKNPIYSVIIKGQMAQLNFDLNHFKQANKNLIRMKLDDGFDHLDNGFKLKIHVAELLIRYELQDTDFLEYQVSQIEKDWSELLNQPNYRRQHLMVSIIKRLITVHNPRNDEEVQASIQEILSGATDLESGDMDWINYNEWIKTRFSL